MHSWLLVVCFVLGLHGCASIEAGQPSEKIATYGITSENLPTILKAGTSIKSFSAVLGEAKSVQLGLGSQKYYLYPYHFKDGTTRVLSVLVNGKGNVVKYMFFRTEWLDAL